MLTFHISMLSPVEIVIKLNCIVRPLVNRRIYTMQRVQTSPPIHSIRFELKRNKWFCVKVFCISNQRKTNKFQKKKNIFYVNHVECGTFYYGHSFLFGLRITYSMQMIENCKLQKFSMCARLAFQSNIYEGNSANLICAHSSHFVMWETERIRH